MGNLAPAKLLSSLIFCESVVKLLLAMLLKAPESLKGPPERTVRPALGRLCPESIPRQQGLGIGDVESWCGSAFDIFV